MFILTSHVSGLTSPTSPWSHWSRLPLSTYSYTSILFKHRRQWQESGFHYWESKLRVGVTGPNEEEIAICQHTCKHLLRSSQATWRDFCAEHDQLLRPPPWTPSRPGPWCLRKQKVDNVIRKHDEINGNPILENSAVFKNLCHRNRGESNGGGHTERESHYYSNLKFLEPHKPTFRQQSISRAENLQDTNLQGFFTRPTVHHPF